MCSAQDQSSTPCPGKPNGPTANSNSYLDQLIWDKYIVDCMPNVFVCAGKLINEEIARVKSALQNIKDIADMECKPQGPVIALSEKLFVPVKKYPDFNFVGRILGPRGMTAKQLEQRTGCKIMVRGRGSMRDKHKEENNRGKPNWEHLNEELHVLITVEDTKEIAEAKIEKAKHEMIKLLIPSVDGEDELKRIQLMELAVLNGTFRNDVGHEGYSKIAKGEPGPMNRQVMSNAMAPGFFLPPYFQTPGKSNAEYSDSSMSTPKNISSGSSQMGLMSYAYSSPYTPYFPGSAEMGGLFYVDPYSPLAGSAYFGNQDYSESPAKSACD